MFARITNNLGLKILAVALALLMSWWVYEVKNPEISKKIDLALKVVNLSPTLLITDPNPLPAKFWVKVHGPLRSVNYIASSTHVARLDCKGLTEPGLSAVRIDIPDLDDVIVDDQELRFLDVRVERKQTIEKQLTVEVTGLVDEHFEISQAELSQDNVTISGPDIIVSQVKEARIEPNLTGVTQSANLMLDVVLLDDNGEVIDGPAMEVDPSRVRYSVTLVSKGTTLVLKVIPEYIGQPADGFIVESIAPDPLLIPIKNVVVEADDRFVRTDPIDLSQKRESFDVVVNLLYPFDLPADSVLPLTCRVSVHIVALEEVGSVRAPVSITGQRSGFDYILAPQDLLIESEATDQAEVDLLAKVSVSLDVSALEPGEYRMVPQLSLPFGLSRVKVDPRSVLVTVIAAE